MESEGFLGTLGVSSVEVAVTSFIISIAAAILLRGILDWECWSKIIYSMFLMKNDTLMIGKQWLITIKLQDKDKLKVILW